MDIELNKIDKATVSLSDVFIIKIPFGKYTMETMQSVYDAFRYCSQTTVVCSSQMIAKYI